jgi:tungstate transport system permease protein
MSFLFGGIEEAVRLIVTLDRELLEAVRTTLRVSLTSTAIASALALPLGFLLASRKFPGKEGILALLKTALALPTVLIGLFVYGFVARSAPLGSLKLLFTPEAIIIGQVLLITPLVTALIHGVLQGTSRTVYEEAILLGASPVAAFWKTILEARVGVVTALMAGFGRVATEIGISLILGGNIRGFTRTITTAISLETAQGDFPRAVALGIVLLLIVFAINVVVVAAGGRSDAVV